MLFPLGAHEKAQKAPRIDPLATLVVLPVLHPINRNAGDLDHRLPFTK